MFCNVCLNPGCTNSRGSTSKWNQRMLTQEDRLLHNPAFAPERPDERMGIPDFKNLIQEALRVEISTQRADWEPVSDADVGRAAAEMMGVVPLSPTGFRPDPIPDPTPDPTPEPEENLAEPPQKIGHPDDISRQVHDIWRVRGDSKDKQGKPKTYTVTLFEDGGWDCTCPSRVECKHIQYIRGRVDPESKPDPTPDPVDPVRPDPAPRRSPFPSAMNTAQPRGGQMIGGGPPPPTPPPESDPWAVDETAPKFRKLGVGGRVTFGSGKKTKK